MDLGHVPFITVFEGVSIGFLGDPPPDLIEMQTVTILPCQLPTDPPILHWSVHVIIKNT